MVNIPRAAFVIGLGATVSYAASEAEAAGRQAPGQAEPENYRIEDVVVRSNADPAAKSEKELKEVPGGGSVIKAEDVSNQHLTVLSDLLGFQPGIFIEGAGNTGAPKISIRGSAVNDGHLYFRTGILYSFDGLPITGPSGTPFELWNPQDFSNTVVLRGANGLGFGAAQLGGAIDFITHTGRDSYQYQARFDAGSYNYFGGQVSSGQVIGPYDYYLSLSGFKADNFQDYNHSRAGRFTANIGYQISPDVDARFYFRYATAFEQETWGVSKSQIKTNPSAGSALNIQDGTDRVNPATFFVGFKSNIRLDDSSLLTLGGDFHHYPIRGHGTIFGATDWQFDDLSFVARYQRHDTLFGRDSKLTVNLLTTTSVNSTVDAYGPKPTIAWTNLQAQSKFTGSSDINLAVTHELEVAPSFWLSNVIAGVLTRRANKFSLYPIAGQLPQQDRLTPDWQGRIGAHYDFDPDTQIFANISRSVQPERAFDPIQFGSGYVTGNQLRNQEATTYELGARGAYGIFRGSLALYYSDVWNELLGVKLNPTDVMPTYSNASPTTHKGIEVGLDTILWSAADSAPEAPHQIVLRQSYTYTRLNYKNDPTFGSNALPGVPPHFYEAEATYRHPSGFYVGVNTKYASSYFVDYANSFKNDAYALLGAKLGYAPHGGNWEVYVQAKNLTDVRYASSVLTQYDLRGQDAPLVFYPGDGRSFFGGVSVHF